MAVYKTWLAERAGTAGGVTAGGADSGGGSKWPDWLARRWEREQTAANRVIRAEQSAGNAQTRRLVSRPQSPSPVPKIPTGAPPPDPKGEPPDPLAHLTDAQREAFVAETRAALRRSLPGAPAALIERLLAGRIARGNGLP